MTSREWSPWYKKNDPNAVTRYLRALKVGSYPSQVERFLDEEEDYLEGLKEAEAYAAARRD